VCRGHGCESILYSRVGTALNIGMGMAGSDGECRAHYFASIDVSGGA
jgi:hypothetical protein